jgi:hypothetical protein
MEPMLTNPDEFTLQCTIIPNSLRKLKAEAENVRKRYRQRQDTPGGVKRGKPLDAQSQPLSERELPMVDLDTYNQTLSKTNMPLVDLDTKSKPLSEIELPMAELDTQNLQSSQTIPLLSDLDPIMTERQQKLMWYYDVFGVLGLAHAMKLIALEEKQIEISCGIGSSKRKRPTHENQDAGGHVSWQKIIDDINLGPLSRILFCLSSICPRLIPALIKGTLPSDMQNPDFAAEVGPHISLHESQGVYAVYVGVAAPDRNTQPSTTISEDVGQGVTPYEFLKISNAMRDYINV